MHKNQTDRILSALAYFSIFFLGFIFPAVLWFVTNNPEVRRHAAAAFISHCIPVVCGFLLFILGIVSGLGVYVMNAEGPVSIAAMIILFGVFGLISLIVAIWNVYKGVKLLMQS